MHRKPISRRRRWAPGPTPPPEGVGDRYGNPDAEWRRIDWSRRVRRVRLDGVEVNLCDHGEGEPILLVHGLGGCWQNFLEQAPHLASRGRRVIAPDLPGFGHSSMPDWELSITRYGRHLVALLDELGIERCAVVGNSMGGFIAAEIAHATPDRVDRLVLVSPAGYSSATVRPGPIMAIGRALARSSSIPGPQGPRGFRRSRARWASWRTVVRAPHRLERELVWECMTNGVGRPGFLPALRSLLGYDFRERLADIAAPTLIVWGRHDRIVPARDAERYRELIPGARLEVFDRTGHLPMLERPARFNAMLDAFLAEPGATAGTGPDAGSQDGATGTPGRVADVSR